jgi:hypothetical protein
MIPPILVNPTAGAELSKLDKVPIVGTVARISGDAIPSCAVSQNSVRDCEISS